MTVMLLLVNYTILVVTWKNAQSVMAKQSRASVSKT